MYNPAIQVQVPTDTNWVLIFKNKTFVGTSPTTFSLKIIIMLNSYSRPKNMILVILI
jgi:hypothetical protein